MTPEQLASKARDQYRVRGGDMLPFLLEASRVVADLNDRRVKLLLELEDLAIRHWTSPRAGAYSNLFSFGTEEIAGEEVPMYAAIEIARDRSNGAYTTAQVRFFRRGGEKAEARRTIQGEDIEVTPVDVEAVPADLDSSVNVYGVIGEYSDGLDRTADTLKWIMQYNPQVQAPTEE